MKRRLDSVELAARIYLFLGRKFAEFPELAPKGQDRSLRYRGNEREPVSG